MEPVFDVPVGADDLEEAIGRQGLGQDVAAAGSGRLAIDLAHAVDLADRPEAREAVLLGEPGHVVDDSARRVLVDAIGGDDDGHLQKG